MDSARAHWTAILVGELPNWPRVSCKGGSAAKGRTFSEVILVSARSSPTARHMSLGVAAREGVCASPVKDESLPVASNPSADAVVPVLLVRRSPLVAVDRGKSRDMTRSGRPLVTASISPGVRPFEVVGEGASLARSLSVRGCSIACSAVSSPRREFSPDDGVSPSSRLPANDSVVSSTALCRSGDLKTLSQEIRSFSPVSRRTVTVWSSTFTTRNGPSVRSASLLFTRSLSVHSTERRAASRLTRTWSPT